MTADILHLAKARSTIPILAKWLYEEWGYLHENDSIHRRIMSLENQVDETKIPFTYVALIDKMPAGTASVVTTDIPDRRDLTPCVASVLVHKNYRRTGIGSALMKAVEKHAQRLGFEKLYLFTWDQEKLYSSLGWKTIEASEYEGKSIVIMEKKIGD